TTAPTLVNTVAAPSGPDISTSSSSYTDIDNLCPGLNLPADGDVVITVCGEAETSDYKRMFIQVLVDGVVSNPSNVVFAVGPFTGVYSFSFLAKNLSAGAHTMQTQWMVDSGGTAYMGDRTVTVAYSDPMTIGDGMGGFYALNAPSGPQVTTTSSFTTTIPNMSVSIPVPANATLAIGFTGEAYTDPGYRMFLNAAIDGVKALPSDVVFTNTGFIGTLGFQFVQKNVSAGAHNIEIQWDVDGGGTASMGDRTMTVAIIQPPCPDMTDAFHDVKPVSGEIPLLVICWDPHRPDHLAPAINDVQNLIFGNYPSVRDYFLVNSNNRFFIKDVGIKGWYDADKPPDHYWAAEDPTDANGDGWISGHVEKWAEAIRKANPDFHFADYDTDGDGNLSPQELGILIVIPQNSPFGTNRIAVGRQYPTEQPLVVDNVTITWIAEAYIGSPLNLGVCVHELSHLLLNLPDMYFTFFQPYAAGGYSMMDQGYADNHIDPFNKIRLGWIQPANVLHSGYIPINAVENSHVAYILHDPAHGNSEYYIIENRQPSGVGGYDSQIRDSGLAVWHIMEDPAVYGNLPAPAGVDAANWASINPADWGRRAIRMIRPVYGPPFNDYQALWDGADPVTGYNLVSSDANPAHAQLQWADGSPSGFGVLAISASGENMTALIEVPSEPTPVDHKPGGDVKTPAKFICGQNYPNPFNPVTTIPFTLGKEMQVTITVYNMLGEKIAQPFQGKQAAGEHTVVWDGTDTQGRNVASGIYFYKIEANRETALKKMMLIR
ncbi:MAG TPA: M6 family metalloprotease domain-containing protein, partial [bacterium]|nr:M6 family metalloprotease domain-containing protein [bacterium]